MFANLIKIKTTTFKISLHVSTAFTTQYGYSLKVRNYCILKTIDDNEEINQVYLHTVSLGEEGN